MRVLWISFAIVIVDQVTKWFAYTRLRPHGDSVRILGDWFKFTYTENPGMAFGVQFGFGPPFLVTLFSIVATIIIVVYLFGVRSSFRPYRVSLALVLGGALGNIIDRVFYGALYYDSPLFQGRVIDFIHLDVIRGMWPEWVPLFGGKGFAMFPIGNVADLTIIAGVVGILIFQKGFHQTLIANAGDGASAASTEAVDTPAAATTAVSSSQSSIEEQA